MSGFPGSCRHVERQDAGIDAKAIGDTVMVARVVLYGRCLHEVRPFVWMTLPMMESNLASAARRGK